MRRQAGQAHLHVQWDTASSRTLLSVTRWRRNQKTFASPCIVCLPRRHVFLGPLFECFAVYLTVFPAARYCFDVVHWVYVHRVPALFASRRLLFTSTFLLFFGIQFERRRGQLGISYFSPERRSASSPSLHCARRARSSPLASEQANVAASGNESWTKKTLHTGNSLRIISNPKVSQGGVYVSEG